jgi:hypothetical protein
MQEKPGHRYRINKAKREQLTGICGQISGKRGDFRSYIWPGRAGNAGDKKERSDSEKQKQKSPLKGADSVPEKHPC